jgi:hypothetical protein
MASNDELVAQLRWLQHECAALPAEDRRARLKLRIRDILGKVTAPDRQFLLADLERAFPGGHTTEGAPPARQSEKGSVSLKQRPVEDLVVDFQAQLARLPAGKREEIAVRLFPESRAHEQDVRVALGRLMDALAKVSDASRVAYDPLVNRTEEVARGEPTTEQVVAEKIRGQLRGAEPRSFSAEDLVTMVALLMVELGCLEILAKKVLETLHGSVFDPLRGTLPESELPSIERLCARWCEPAGAADLSSHVRRCGGLVKCLMTWLGFACGQTSGLAEALDPETIKAEAPKARKEFFTLGSPTNPYEVLWNVFRAKHRDKMSELVGFPSDPGQMDQIDRLIRESLGRKIAASVVNHYQWPSKQWGP